MLIESFLQIILPIHPVVEFNLIQKIRLMSKININLTFEQGIFTATSFC